MIDFSKMEGPQDYPWEWKTGGLYGATGVPILWPSFKEGYGPVVGGSPDVKAMTAVAPAMKDEILRLRAERDELVEAIEYALDDYSCEGLSENALSVLETAIKKAKGE